MSTYVAMLRGINLGSHNKVAMPALRALFEALGHQDVTTYIQSGNVVFRASGNATRLADAIGEAIAKELGLDVTVLVRTKQQLKNVLNGNPFLEQGKDPAALHVVFLSDKPKPDRIKQLTGKDWHPDEIVVSGTEVYLHCPNGYGRSKLGNAFLEKQLGVAGTTRNWRTTAKLAELAGS